MHAQDLPVDQTRKGKKGKNIVELVPECPAMFVVSLAELRMESVSTKI